MLRIGYDRLRLLLLHPGCRTPALHCLVSDHLQKKDKCCEVPPRQRFAGCTLKLRKRGGEQQGTIATKIEVPIVSETRTDCCCPCGTSALAREGRPSRTSLATRPIVLAPQNSIYPVTRFDEHGTWVLVREASQPREATSHRRAQRTSRHLRQADPYSLWRDPPRRSSTSSRSRSPDRRPGPAEHYRLDSEEEPPQDAVALTTGRAAYVPRRVYEAPTRSLLLCIAGGLEQHSNRHQRPHQRSFLAASLHCPRNFLVQLLRYRQKQLFLENHLLEQGPLFGLRVHSGTRLLREV